MKVIQAKDLKTKPSAIKSFPVGGCWEESAWEIQYDATIMLDHDDQSYVIGCPHMGEAFEVEHIRIIYGTPYRNKMAICPRVVVGTTQSSEGGEMSTGICLDCILEAAKTL